VGDLVDAEKPGRASIDGRRKKQGDKDEDGGRQSELERHDFLFHCRINVADKEKGVNPSVIAPIGDRSDR
jgi:hypothetical protein